MEIRSFKFTRSWNLSLTFAHVKHFNAPCVTNSLQEITTQRCRRIVSPLSFFARFCEFLRLSNASLISITFHSFRMHLIYSVKFYPHERSVTLSKRSYGFIRTKLFLPGQNFTIILSRLSENYRLQKVLKRIDNGRVGRCIFLLSFAIFPRFRIVIPWDARDTFAAILWRR